MEGMFEGTFLMEIYLYQDPQALLKSKMGNFDESDLQKDYARAQGKYDETVTIARRSRQVGRKLKAQIKTFTQTGFNNASSEDPSITSILT